MNTIWSSFRVLFAELLHQVVMCLTYGAYLCACHVIDAGDVVC